MCSHEVLQEAIAELRRQNAELLADRDGYLADREGLVEALGLLLADRERLAEALRWYAGPAWERQTVHYEDGDCWSLPILSDHGERARAALGEQV